jgi:NAD+ diphosphatase
MPRLDLGPQPLLGYTPNRLERGNEQRGNVALLAALESAPGAGAYVIVGELIILKQHERRHEPLFHPSTARALGAVSETVFLGLRDGVGFFGVSLDPVAGEELKARDGLAVFDLRSIAVQGIVEPEHLAPLAEAKALLHWHRRHRFCANCGSPTNLVMGGWRRDCPTCGAQHFPRTDPVVIMLACDRERCLLGRQRRFAPGMWSCLAGFVEPAETIEEAVQRETLEEAGISCDQVTYFASQPWPFPMSLMIGCFARARSVELTVDRVELEDARWFDRDEVSLMLLRGHPERLTTPPPVAIAHHIIRNWVEHGDRVFG